MIDGAGSSSCTASSSASSMKAFSNSNTSPSVPSSISVTMSNYSFPPPPSARDMSKFHQQQFFDYTTPSPRHISPLTLKRNSIDEVGDRLNCTQIADRQPAHYHHPQQQQQPPTSAPAPPQSQGNPYARAPELKISHKLAERKRRKEMRDLFDELRTVLPQPTHTSNGGHSVGSKWETLFRGFSKDEGIEEGTEELEQ
ncbi:hypothetical protein BY996DRAFT_6414717 [Phakopsora pachyrhizi]|nr:hypothetical protein BY996DRAFT_6414717 [Phakopsora pachyrhizi]